MGTMRTISIVQGRTKIAFILGFFEVSMWLVVISAVVNQILSKPILGFSTPWDSPQGTWLVSSLKGGLLSATWL
jgi:hypothetical protein